ncbi:DUF4402 domain-containing protein [Montanilutibacter psychrotolerans]|uniref:DUF4402 domain-containing protein n=1 Tax=Montanilutibacter psychrotolerans TaxID=1327343 RepID=A0A3M8SV94_9GAMM|nr:DUF4402 domain-containing protein [Lysobacter psychrotolerans]RNF85247.1 DUF4402 domain-containing protein [Lysobacter psychrotolerans]
MTSDSQQDRPRYLLIPALWVLLGFASEPVPMLHTSSACDQRLELRTLRPLDFGDVRIKARQSGFVSVRPDGGVIKSDNVVVRRDPVSGEMDVCGAPGQRIAVVVRTPVAPTHMPQGRPAATHISQFMIKDQGLQLERIDAERWEGQLGASGRARLFVGATLMFRDDGVHGALTSSVSIDVEPL